MQITGGANFPAARFGGGRLNATWPFGVLTVDPGRLRLRIRLFGAVWQLSGAQPLAGTPEDIVEVFPCRGRLGTPGVGLRTVQGHRYFFWTSATATVLDACRREGFTVSTEVQKM
ncbi:hypothetical protein OG588_12380 [Streptomyces prunicolor]|uniref:hypothetical protein n=1 Tax=Streptomyces prunicolor TaxID=67348 RepID=UPI0038662491|nr:hypothetical protein OG588_12380 [Streptomyces prunicolor]